MNFIPFFPSEEKIFAIPNWAAPRVLLTEKQLKNIGSIKNLYSSSRTAGKLKREALMQLAGLSLLPFRRNNVSSDALQNFLNDENQFIFASAAVVGEKSNFQKITIRLVNREFQPVGYIKYGETDFAKKRIINEYHLLQRLPAGVAPRSIKLGPLGEGLALWISDIPGSPVKADSYWADGVKEYQANLTQPTCCTIEDHPWVIALTQTGKVNHSWLEGLSDRSWPVAFQHGDFAPWNLIRGQNGRLFAIDWEAGLMEGFPYIDLIYYTLRVAAIVYKKKPAVAARQAVSRLMEGCPELSSRQATALTRLTAVFSWNQRLREGRPEADYLLNWYNQMIEGAWD